MLTQTLVMLCASIYFLSITGIVSLCKERYGENAHNGYISKFLKCNLSTTNKFPSNLIERKTFYKNHNAKQKGNQNHPHVAAEYKIISIKHIYLSAPRSIFKRNIAAIREIQHGNLNISVYSCGLAVHKSGQRIFDYYIYVERGKNQHSRAEKLYMSRMDI